MRSITVSTDVYAAVWSARQPGENDEDAILRRVLKAPLGEQDVRPPITAHTGLFDNRTGTQFADGFRIFRSYKGKDYAAVVRSGKWTREDTGQPFKSLNELNSSIVSGQENVWNGNWKFRQGDGSVASIATVRGKLN